MEIHNSSKTAKSIRQLLLTCTIMLHPTITSAQSTNITFADTNVKAICVQKWDTNNDGELSYDEAAAVTDLGQAFLNNKEITSFNELQLFTGLTKIGGSAFKGCFYLSSVTLPDGLISIGNSAFSGCQKLPSITFPNSLTSIGNNAFSTCHSLTSITIPSSVTNIGSAAFSNCTSIKSIVVNSDNKVYDSRDNCNAIIRTDDNMLIAGCNYTVIPNSVAGIGDNVFNNCHLLTSITLSNNITIIGSEAFSGCYNLASFNIPSSVTSVGENAFYATKWWMNQGDGVIYHDNWIIGCKNDKPSGDYIIPEGTKGVADGVFDGCSDLTSITFPNTIISIGEWAFYGCSGLSTLILPSSLTTIEDHTFESCDGLTEVISMIIEPFAIPNNCWFGVTRDIPLYVPTGTKESYKKTEGWNVFNNIIETSSCIAVNETTFPDENFRNWILNQDYGIDGMLTEGEIAAITEINISNTEIADLKGIEYFTALTYLDCSYNQLTSLNVSKNTSLQWLYCSNNQIKGAAMDALIVGLTETDGSFYAIRHDDDNSNEQNVVTEAQVAAAKAKGWTTYYYNNESGNWDKYAGCAPVPEGNIEFADNAVKTICIQNWDTDGDGELSYDEAAAVTNLGNVFFFNSQIDSFKELQFFTNLTNISSAFYGSSLNTVSIPSSVTSIGNNAFGDCKYLTTVSIPNSVTIIEKHAFQGCKSLTSFNLPNSVKTIGEGAFYGCTGMTSFTLSNSVTSIDAEAFRDCENLASLIIPSSVTSIGISVFFGCNALASIKVESKNTVYDSREECNAIIKTEDNELIAGCKNTVIPNTVTKIGFAAFAGCSSLTSITIPSSVLSIDRYVFQDCSSLTSIKVENNNNVFDSRDNCNAIIKTENNELIVGCKNTVIPNTVTKIGFGAFEFCSGLTSIKIPDSVTIIESSAFYECEDLVSVDIGNSVTSIRWGAFYCCSSLDNVTIPNSVTTIGESAFFGCMPKVIHSFIENPFDIYDVFTSYLTDNCTLYVPVGTKKLYEATEGWKNFKHIVEMVDLEPIGEDDSVDYGNSDDISEETDLSGTMVDNMYYSIGTDAGGFDSQEGCIVITQETTDEQMELIKDLEITEAELNENFTGIIFKVPAGNGKVTVTAETTGNMTLKVKVGNGTPMEMELSGKLKMKVPYDVTEETMIYIFAGTQSASRGTLRTSGEQSLKIYDIVIEIGGMMGDVDGNNKVNAADIEEIANAIVGKPSKNYNKAAADMDDNDIVDIIDLTRIIQAVKPKQ